jgi:protocatechuate 3,4-dioxygenase beta subunit
VFLSKHFVKRKRSAEDNLSLERKKLKLSFVIITLFALALCFFSSSLILPAPDIYEPDDTPAEATLIPTDGTTQSHTYDPMGESDWFKFNTEPGKFYIIETLNLSNGCDTYLYLYDSAWFISDENDDGGSAPLASKMYINSLYTASTITYYIKSADVWNNGGKYDIKVTALTPGSISGQVIDANGNPLGEVDVFVFDNDGNWVYGGITNWDGTYSVALPPGYYKVAFDPEWHNVTHMTNYLCEWYKNKLSFGSADFVTVASGANTSGINAQLEEGEFKRGNFILGTVIDANGNPLSDIYVDVYDTNYEWVGNAWTDQNGNYTVHALPSGNYKVSFDPWDHNNMYGTDYLSEWYNNKPDFDSADIVTVTQGQKTSGINAVLEEESGGGDSGSISGQVTDANGNPLQGITIDVYDTNWNWVGWGYTDQNGNYTVYALPPGSYKVSFDPWNHNWMNGTDYLSEWYNNKRNFDSANPVTVTQGQETSGVDAVLEVGGRISGTVTDANGNPLSDVWVSVYDLNGNYMGGDFVDSNGSYTIYSLLTGGYKVFFDPWDHNQMYGTDYLSEWYNNKPDFDSADLVSVTQGQETSEINAQLEVGGRISGTVTDSNGNPLSNVWVDIYSTEGEWVSGSFTDGNGNYAAHGIPEGNWKVLFDPEGYNWMYGTDYLSEWYNDKLDFDSADLVSVTQGQETSEINAQLEVGGRISGTVTNEQGEPLIGVLVNVYDAAAQAPIEKLGTAWTEESGRYVLHGLSPGEYKVFFDPSLTNEWHSTSYFAEWFQNKPDFISADSVFVSSEQETSGINAQLSEVDITPPQVEVGYPNGGEIFVAGSEVEVTWTASDDHLGSNPISILFSFDGGSNFTTLTAGGPNDGRATVTIPQVNSTQCLVKVLAEDEAGNEGYDISDSPFIVYTPVTDYLLITEIMYHPIGNEPGAEWIEIYNPTTQSINLSNIKIGDEETPGEGEGMYRFPYDTYISPESTIVVANKATAFYSAYGYLPDFEIIDSTSTVVDLIKYKNWATGSISLANGGDELLLLDENDNPIDVVVWENGSYTGIIPHSEVSKGNSLERFPVNMDTDDCSVDFREQSSPNPAAGGAVYDTTPPTTSFNTNPSSPNGDNGWFITTPTIAFSPNEPATTYYQWDSTTGAWAEPNIAITPPSEGIHTLYFYSIDESKNKENVKSQVIKCDFTSPTDPTTFESTPTTGTWTTDNSIEISWSGADDALSGVDGYSVSWTKDTTEIPDTVKDLEETEESTSTTLSDGIWYFNLRTRDKAGNWSNTVHIGPFKIDTKKPSAYIKWNQPYSTNQSPNRTFYFAWDSNDSDVISFDVEYRPHWSTTWYPLYTETTKKFTYLSGSEGTTYYLRVRAKDNAGNIGPWSTIKNCTIPYDNTHKFFTFSGKYWYYIYSSKRFRANSIATSAKNHSFKLKNTLYKVKQIVLIVTKRPNGGKAKVYINGKLIKTIDTYSKTYKYRVPIPIKTYSSPKTIWGFKVLTTKTKNPASKGYKVEIDGVGVKR